jgi:uncharacterized protein with GYD domain
MPMYALFFTYTPNAWDAMVENPRDRAAQARAVVEAADGTMEAVYWMFGPHDGTAFLTRQARLARERSASPQAARGPSST